MTVVSGPAIGKELGKTFREIELQIKSVEEQAQKLGISVYSMRDSYGNFVLAPLLVAKANTLHAIVLVNQR
jgi:biotin operon repressor